MSHKFLINRTNFNTNGVRIVVTRNLCSYILDKYLSVLNFKILKKKSVPRISYLTIHLLLARRFPFVIPHYAMSESSHREFSTSIAPATPVQSSFLTPYPKAALKSFLSPSFISPIPTCTSHKDVQQHLTLCGQTIRKTNPLDVSTHPESTKIKHQSNKTRGKVIRALEDISNKTKSFQHDPTRKLEFRTPLKPPSKLKKNTRSSSFSSSSSSSSSSSLEEEKEEEEEALSSDDAFNATTIDTMRVRRETPIQSPAVSTAVATTKRSSSLGRELSFSVSSTVSSVAIAPNGTFLVVGCYNGMVYLYPLTTDSLRFQRGVLLDQIMPRGMYTQIMVTVSIPDDGQFIFAGVYRGSTDIRAFEVDSIRLPLATESLQARKMTTALSLLTRDDSDESEESEDDDIGVFGLPTAKVVSHTYSDAKLKGFAVAKRLYHKKNNKTEYRLLCGIGIKNVHLWRFYQKKTENTNLKWSWECIFDKQTNGISLEFISFHPTIANQFISKSEHQNVRIWHLEENYDDINDSVTIRKKSHTDVKQTVDTVAVHGDYAYGGSESLAIIDLQAGTRMDLDLPLSAKEQRAQHEAVINSSNANPLRAWNPRGSRRRGADDTSGQRHMRTVSKVAGQDASPFTVGMCSDGSVFYHQPKKEIGIVTPLDYIEGYEEFFADPSLDFQAQFSDLTRVNTSGLLAVLPLPETEKEEWMIVAANQDQLLVRSLEAFLHRNQQKKEYSQVKSGLRNVMRDLGGAESSTDEASSDSDVNEKNATKEKHQRQKKQDKTILKRSRQENALKPEEIGRKIKQSRHDSEKVIFRAKALGGSGEIKKPSSSSKSGSQKKSVQPKQLSETDDQEEGSDSTTAVTTPKCTTNRNDGKISTSTASPIVSISSWSGSSNPNTPEQVRLSRVERQLKAFRELEWTPPHAAVAKSRPDNQQKSVGSAVNAVAVLTQLSSSSNQAKTKTKNVSSGKKTARRMKAQALFTNYKSAQDRAKKKNSEIKKKAEAVSSLLKETAVATLSNKCSSRAGSGKHVRLQVEKQDAVPSEPNKPTEADNHMAEEEDILEEKLEQYEPEFVCIPLVSDESSLLAATMYQYADPASKWKGDIEIANADDDIKADCAAATTEQTNLLMQFADQNERLKMNFLAERERIYKHLDCSCASHACAKKSSTASTSGINWRRNVAHDYSKWKQSNRRHKKQLATKLHQLRARYAVQMQELSAIQQMQANAFRARQQFQHLHKQFCRQAIETDSASSSSPKTVAPPLKHSVMPDHLSGASFPYPDLLS